MVKQEFLEKLRVALSGRVSSGVIAENLCYYEDYINMEIRKGRREEEVLAALGDPRLIAKTIVETRGGRGGDTAQGAENHTAQRNRRRTDREAQGHVHRHLKVPAVLWLIVVILIVILIISTIFSVIRALLPIILPILLVLLAVKIFRDWLH